MDIVLKNVSVECLCSLKLSVECSIHCLENEISNMEHEINSISDKYGLCFQRENLKEKKNDLVTLRNLYKQL